MPIAATLSQGHCIVLGVRMEICLDRGLRPRGSALANGFELGLSGGREKSLGKQGVLKKQSKEDHPGNQACGTTGHKSANGEFTPNEIEITRQSQEDFKVSMSNTRHNKKTIKLKGPPSIKDI